MASHAPAASISSEVSLPIVDTRASARLQPASAMRLVSASSGVRDAGVSAWISSWLALPARAEGRFKEGYLWVPAGRPAGSTELTRDAPGKSTRRTNGALRRGARRPGTSATDRSLHKPDAAFHWMQAAGNILCLPSSRDRVLDIRGSICALATPFADDGALDLPAFGRLLVYQLAGGTQAVVVAGSTGEAHMLEHAEFDRLLAFAVERVAGRVPVIAGTGEAGTART